MKVFPLVACILFSLLLDCYANTPSLTIDTTITKETNPLTQTELGLPTMREKNTIIDSVDDLSLDLDDSENSYGDTLTDLSAIYDSDNSPSMSSQRSNALLTMSIAFIIEIIITACILKIAFKLCQYPSPLLKLIPLSIAVAAFGVILTSLLNLGLFNPIRIGLSFLVLLVLIRAMSNAHKWSKAAYIAFSAQLVTVTVLWIALIGITTLVNL